MSRPNIVKERDDNDKLRKKAKKKYDKHFKLSDDGAPYKLSTTPSIVVSDDGYHRLLDEGTITYGDGSIRGYIKKGAIKEWYDQLEDDYIGIFNKGHVELGQDPSTIIGTWQKSDLRLVDIGDGRYAVDVKVKLNDELYWVKDLKRSMQDYKYAIGISAEFYSDVDWVITWDTFDGALYHETIDLRDIGVVGTVGNVNSGGLKLNENEEMNEMNIFEKLGLKVSNEKKDDKEDKGVELSSESVTDEDLQAMITHTEKLQSQIEELETALIAENKRANDAVEKLSSALKEVEKEEKDTVAKFKSIVSSSLEKEKQKNETKNDKLYHFKGGDMLGGL